MTDLLDRLTFLEDRVRSYRQTKEQAAPIQPEQQPELTQIDLNPKQLEAVRLALKGESFVLTGAAGTGKTLTVNAIANAFLQNDEYNILDEEGYKLTRTLPMVTFRDPTGGVNEQETKPAIAFCAFTNRAVNNMAGNLRKHSPDLMDDLYSNFMTIHKLIEVAPEYYYDDVSQKDKMRFTPRRDDLNRLPIKVLIIEEASMVDLDLWHKLFIALEPDCQIILLGDLNQLPPVFGDSILNYGLIKLPVIELTHVYRQALDSPIIRQMHEVLKGIPPKTDTDDFQVITGKSTKPIGPDRTGKQVANLMEKLYDNNQYDPIDDIVLSPFNKNGCGTIMLNTLIASWLDKKYAQQGEPRKVYEVIAGFNKHYYAVGDLVYDGQSKMQARITQINTNGNYYGTYPQEASVSLSRFGIMDAGSGSSNNQNQPDELEDFSYNTIDITTLPDGTAGGITGIAGLTTDEAEKKLLSSSHVITLELEDGTEVSRDSAGEVNALDFGYCLTTHKAQGCEWANVFVVIHQSHFIANREWLYTSGTRAKNKCYIITKPDTLKAVVARQRIKGNSLEAKIKGFNKKLLDKLAKHNPEQEQELRTITFNRREYKHV